MKRLINTLIFASLGLGVSVNAATVLTAEGGGQGSSSHVPLVALGKAASNAGVAELQVTDGNTLTKSILNIALGKTDMGIVPVAAANLLSAGKGPYKKLDKGKRTMLKSNLRTLFGFEAGYYGLITYADSGIQSLADIKGKKVLVGPPSGAASANAIKIIAAETGYKPNEDYEAVKMGWGAVSTAFTDRKVDLLVRPATWPSAIYTQLQASGEIRIIGGTDKLKQSKLAKAKGMEVISVPTSQLGEGNYTFNNSTDGHVDVLAYKMVAAVNKNLDEETVYQITKAFFTDYDEAMKAAAWMPALKIDQVTIGLKAAGIPIHPGALRYYQEAGIGIPAELH